MQHHFDIQLAQEYGILEAVLLDNIQFWIKKNIANNQNYFDGSYWTYNSIHAFSELFPYASEKQIRTALKKLVDVGLIKTGNYNKSAYDRTLWYAFTEKGLSILPIGQMEVSEKSNEIDQQGKPIPYTNADVKPDDIKKYNKKAIENEFERLWKEYPKKQGKENAFKAYLKERSKRDYGEFNEYTVLDGIKRYKAYIEASKIAPQYIKQGSTWFNQHCWEDDYTIEPKDKEKSVDQDYLNYLDSLVDR